MKHLVLALIAMISMNLSAQKDKTEVDYDKKTGNVTANDVPVFKVIEEKSSKEPLMKDYTIQSLDGKNLMMLVIDSYLDSHEISQSNPHGNVSYYKVRFFDDKKSSCEIAFNFFKKTIKQIYASNLIKDGKLDADAVDIFVMKNGNTFTELKGRR